MEGKELGFSYSLICFCDTSELYGVKSPLYSSCFQKESRKNNVVISPGSL